MKLELLALPFGVLSHPMMEISKMRPESQFLESGQCLDNMPLIIAHRGASGAYPQASTLAYEAATKHAGALECDLALTKDLVLICLHDAYLDETTNFPDIYPNEPTQTRLWTNLRRKDHYTVDYTWDQLSQVNKKQDYSFRDQLYNSQARISLFSEYLDLALQNNLSIYPETKDPADFNNWLKNEMGYSFTFEDIFMESLLDSDFSKYGPENNLKIYFQSFSNNSLYKLISLNQKYKIYPDNLSKFISLNHVLPTTKQAEKMLANGITGLGLNKDAIVIKQSLKSKPDYNHIMQVKTDELTNFVDLGFEDLHIFTFKNENEFLLFDFHQDYSQEIHFWLENLPMVTGFFTDFSESMLNSFKLWCEARQ